MGAAVAAGTETVAIVSGTGAAGVGSSAEARTHTAERREIRAGAAARRPAERMVRAILLSVWLRGERENEGVLLREAEDSSREQL